MGESETLLAELAEQLRDLSFSEQTTLVERCVEQCGVVMTIAKLAQTFAWERQLISNVISRSRYFKKQKREIKTIGMFYHRFYNGGTENIMALLTDVFGDMGYKVVLYTDDEPNELDYQTNHEYTRVVLPPHGEVNSNYLERGEKLSSSLAEHSVDCFVWHAWMSDLTLWDMLVIKYEGIPFITYNHSCFAFPTLTADWLYHYDMPAVFSLMDAVVVLSRVDKAYWSEFCENVFWINQPLRNSLLKPQTSTAPNTNLVWVGRLSYEKNPEALLKIMKKVVREVPEAKLTIVGKAETVREQEAFARAVNEHGLSEAITLAGHQKEVSAYYENASIMLSTSIVEGYPLTISEAKGFGVPSVMYDLPFLEVAREGKGVIAVPFDDSESFAQQLVSIIKDKDKRSALSEEARQSLEDYLSKQDVAKDWKRILGSLFDVSGRQSIGIDRQVEETQHILWKTNNRFTEIGLRGYVHKTNLLLGTINKDVVSLEKENEDLKQDIEGFKQGIVKLENDLSQMVRDYEESKTYRTGLAVLYIPRKIRWWFIRNFAKKK